MAELIVNKKSISKLFKDDMQNRKFIIPDYQRPYAWDVEKCETLWDDVVENAQNPNEDYFLGTIVVYKLGGNYMVIDGQQRITSFFQT
jgi:uncharacterized protein with ParB-like and HNH nuclease domain